jgi:hypothetical protein
MGHSASPARRDPKRDPYRTLEIVRSPAALRTARTFRRSRGAGSILGYTLAAVAGALLVALGVLLGSLVRSPEAPQRPASVRTTTLAAPPVSDRPIAIAPDNPPAKPAMPPIAEAPVRAEAAAPRRVEKPRPARMRRPAVAISEGSAPTVRYCARVDETPFRPASANGSAEGSVRSDAELMHLKISVPEGAGADAGPAVARILFENGGDSSILLDRLEVASASSDLRRAAGATLPIRIPAGGLKEIYRYPLTLAPGETGARQFVVVDRDGDSWGAMLHPVPCGN